MHSLEAARKASLAARHAREMASHTVLKVTGGGGGGSAERSKQPLTPGQGQRPSGFARTTTSRVATEEEQLQRAHQHMHEAAINRFQYEVGERGRGKSGM